MPDIRNLVIACLTGLALFFTLTGCATVESPSAAQPAPIVPAEKSSVAEPAQTEEEKAVEASETAPQEGESQEEPVPEPTCFVHKVRWNGECLTIISKWYTGRFDQWRSIVEANPGMNPDRINLGDEIKIPVDLLITEDPLPQEYVSKYISDSKKE